MDTLEEQLNNFFDSNQSKLNKFPIIKVIYRPITIHIHQWLEQFENKDYFIWSKPNKNLAWTSRKAPSIKSQKRRVLTCFGFTNEKEKNGLYNFGLSEDGKKARDLYFSKKGYKNQNEIPDYLRKVFYKSISETNLNNINIGTNIVLRALNMIANEGYFYTSSPSLKFAPDIIKAFCIKYFKGGESPDLLNWVYGIIGPLKIVRETNLNPKTLLGISKEDSKKIKVYELTSLGINLIESLSIVSKNFVETKKISEKKENDKNLEIIKTLSPDEYFDRRNRVITAKKIKIKDFTETRNLEKFLKQSNTKSSIRYKTNPRLTAQTRKESTQMHDVALFHAKNFVQNKKIKVHYDPIDMYFEFEQKMHIFEVKSWIPSNLTGQFRKGIAQLLDYEYQFKFEDETFKDKECFKHLLFHSDPSELFRSHYIRLMKDLKISLCYINNKILTWHKDFKNNDPFLKN